MSGLCQLLQLTGYHRETTLPGSLSQSRDAMGAYLCYLRPSRMQAPPGDVPGGQQRATEEAREEMSSNSLPAVRGTTGAASLVPYLVFPWLLRTRPPVMDPKEQL